VHEVCSEMNNGLLILNMGLAKKAIKSSITLIENPPFFDYVSDLQL